MIYHLCICWTELTLVQIHCHLGFYSIKYVTQTLHILLPGTSVYHNVIDIYTDNILITTILWKVASHDNYKQRVLMHGHQGWNVRHGLCHIYMIYVYIWVVYSFCLFCCLFIIVTTQFVAQYKPCKPKPKPSTYDPPTPPPPPPPPPPHPPPPHPPYIFCYIFWNIEHVTMNNIIWK